MLIVVAFRLLFFDYFVKFRLKQTSGIKKLFFFLKNLTFGFKQQYFNLLHVNTTTTLSYIQKGCHFDVKGIIKKKSDFFTLIIFIVKNIQPQYQKILSRIKDRFFQKIFKCLSDLKLCKYLTVTKLILNQNWRFHEHNNIF